MPQIKAAIDIMILGYIFFIGYKDVKKYHRVRRQTGIKAALIVMMYLFITSMVHYNQAKEDKFTSQAIQENEFIMQERDNEQEHHLKSFNYNEKLNKYDAEVSKRQKEIHNEI